MNSYQRRKQEISYLRERVAKLEALLPACEIRQLDQDDLNKRRSMDLQDINKWKRKIIKRESKIVAKEALYGGARGGSMKSTLLTDWAVQTIREAPFTVETITTKDVKPL